MPFAGSAGSPGSGQIAMSSTVRPEVLSVANGTSLITRPINITALGRVQMVVEQTSGIPGAFRLECRVRGDTPNTIFPTVAIATVGVPVRVDVPIAARNAAIRCFGAVAGGPHVYQTTLMVIAGS